jgi:hypothetical protein
VLIKRRFKPRFVRTVALCAIDDLVLRPIAERYGIQVVVDDRAARLKALSAKQTTTIAEY